MFAALSEAARNSLRDELVGAAPCGAGGSASESIQPRREEGMPGGRGTVRL